MRLAVAVSIALVVATAAAGSTSPLPAAATFLSVAQRSNGGFAEAGGKEDATLTAWSALALVAAGGGGGARARALVYLRAHEGDAQQATDVALAAVARAALGDRPDSLLARLGAVAPGSALNAEIWTILAFRAAGEAAPDGLVRDVLAAQARSGGWSWARRVQPDSNDTAAAVEALRAAGVGGRPISRALAALQGFRNKDGGYALTHGRDSDAQSTAWAIQAMLAAGAKPSRATWRYVSRLRRPDGSYRYSVRYATTPVWVTAQVVPALAGRPFPLSGR